MTKPVTRSCPRCLAEFEVPYASVRKIYCSEECVEGARRVTRVLKFNCVQCKVPFEAEYQRAFCGKECYAAWSSENMAYRVPAQFKIDMERESRGACLKLRGPCKITSCRCHLGSPDSGGLKVRRLPMLPRSMCAIKEAGEGRTLEEVAAILGCTRERVRQIEQRVLQRLRNTEALEMA